MKIKRYADGRTYEFKLTYDEIEQAWFELAGARYANEVLWFLSEQEDKEFLEEHGYSIDEAKQNIVPLSFLAYENYESGYCNMEEAVRSAIENWEA